MYDPVALSHRIVQFDEVLDKLKERAIPEEVMGAFHRAVLEVAKERRFIIKGSRAAQALLSVSIYTEDQLKYSDYDLISADPFGDLVAIGERMIALGVPREWLEVRNTVFKTDVYRLNVLRTPLADSEGIPERIFRAIPYGERDGVRYLDPSYWKIDLYSILSRPVYINVKSWKKTMTRVQLLEREIPYSGRRVAPKGGDRFAELEGILGRIRGEVLPAGLYAHRVLLGDPIPVPYLELLAVNYKGLVRELGRILGEKPREYPSYLHMMGRMAVFTKAIVFEITMCTSYSVKEGRKYASPYYQMFHFNFLKWATSVRGFAEEPAYYDYLMSRVRLRKLPTMQCLGDTNPGAREFIEFMQKHREKRVIHRFTEQEE